MTASNTTMDDGINASELLDTLQIAKSRPRTRAGGVWVTGTMGGHRFEALIFPWPAINRESEVGGDKRRSKQHALFKPRTRNIGHTTMTPGTKWICQTAL